jgi:hypothetical protein
MPRHTHTALSKKRSRSKPEREGSSRQRKLSTPELDARALALREAGTNFSAIARTLELERATDAHRCFVRALGTLEGSERRRVVENEEARLDELEARIKNRDAADAAKVARRLQGVTNFRKAIVQ